MVVKCAVARALNLDFDKSGAQELWFRCEDNDCVCVCSTLLCV